MMRKTLVEKGCQVIRLVLLNATRVNYNTTPRKALAWLTPLEAFKKNITGVALQT